MRNQKHRCPFSHKLSVDLDELMYAATSCRFVEAHAKFFLPKKHSRERTVLTRLYEV